MKRNALYLFAVLLVSIFSFKCNNESDLTKEQTLKESISTGVQNVKTAMSEISSNAGYQVLTVSNSTVKSLTSTDSLYTNSVMLSAISGIYNYKPSLVKTPWGFSISSFFTKSGTSNLFVIKMPEEKVKDPRTFKHFLLSDTALTNNYVVTVSDYQYRYTPFVGYDYKNTSNINIKNVDAGKLVIKNNVKFLKGFSFNSEYTFTNGYVTKCQTVSGDTTISVYSISKDNKVLFEEKFVAIRKDSAFRHGEREYTLTIGNVSIIRTDKFETAKVFVDGVLQANAKVEIVDAAIDPENQSICKKREIKITFEDGTSTTVSQLAGGAITDITTLFTGLRQVFFATNVVDLVAYEIYKKGTAK